MKRESLHFKCLYYGFRTLTVVNAIANEQLDINLWKPARDYYGGLSLWGETRYGSF